MTHRPELAAVPEIGEKARRSTGEALGALGRNLFPAGVLATTFSHDPAQAADETADLITRGAEVIFEAAFWVDGLFARCDVIERIGDEWRMTEFKSATRVKEDHIEDLAFQVMVATKAGLKIRQAVIGHIDSTNERGATSLTPAQLFAFADVTADVMPLVANVETWAKALAPYGQGDIQPEVMTNIHCRKPYKCAFYKYCHESRPEHDLPKLPGIRADKVIEFRKVGIETIDAIPDTEKLSSVQLRVRNAIRTGQTYVGPILIDELAKLQYPAHFVDFEAAGPAVPLFAGMRSYQAFPFQWSDHRLDSENAEPDHAGFLDTVGGDPRVAFAASLYERIKDAASVVFYSPYELTTVRTLAKQGIPLGAELTTILETRGFDLFKLVRDEVYHAGFAGSFSIKKVLPALVSDASYEKLEIRDGDSAAAEYLRMHSHGTIQTEKERIANALIAYCRQDTLAMVKLYRALVNLAAPTSPSSPLQSQPRLF